MTGVQILIKKLCNYINVVLQVQTGFGRTGEHYWGFEMQGVKPDIGNKETLKILN